MTGRSEELKVYIYKLGNRLLSKLGLETRPGNVEGYLAPENIAEADKLIEMLCRECPTTIAGHLAEIDKLWAEMRDLPQNEKRDGISKQIFTLAHEIKDIGSMCGFELVAFFAESLRDYIDQAEPRLAAQRLIVQAHIDAMNNVHKQGLKTDGGPVADELKKMVKVAIEKYSTK